MLKSLLVIFIMSERPARDLQLEKQALMEKHRAQLMELLAQRGEVVELTMDQIIADNLEPGDELYFYRFGDRDLEDLRNGSAIASLAVRIEHPTSSHLGTVANCAAKYKSARNEHAYPSGSLLTVSPILDSISVQLPYNQAQHFGTTDLRRGAAFKTRGIPMLCFKVRKAKPAAEEPEDPSSMAAQRRSAMAGYSARMIDEGAEEIPFSAIRAADIQAGDRLVFLRFTDLDVENYAGENPFVPSLEVDCAYPSQLSDNRRYVFFGGKSRLLYPGYPIVSLSEDSYVSVGVNEQVCVFEKLAPEADDARNYEFNAVGSEHVLCFVFRNR